MKKFVVCFRTVMYLLALTLGFQSCDKDDDPVTNDKGQVLAVIYDNAEQNENWGEDTKTAPKTVWLQDDASSNGLHGRIKADHEFVSPPYRDLFFQPELHIAALPRPDLLLVKKHCPA